VSTVEAEHGPNAGTLNVDVCVIGAGPAGAAAAIAVRSTGAQVCLITAPPQRFAGLELISGRARTALHDLELLDAVSTAQPCAGSVIRWTDADFDEQSCLLDPDGGGWIVERRRFDDALHTAALRLGMSVLVQRVVEVEELSAQRQCARTSDREVVADAVVIASGATRNPVRRLFDRHERRRMVALGVRLEPDAVDDLGHRLLVDHAPNGWWYAIADRTATDVVYCTDAGMAKGARGIRAAWREACLSAADWLPSAARRRRPRVRPATVGVGWPSTRGRTRLVGDAALTVDPLSGHGITLALLGAMRWNELDYADWLADTARSHDRMESDVYRAACAVDGPFWDPRRA
jgi:flavin-dependent dehydrogenase